MISEPARRSILEATRALQAGDAEGTLRAAESAIQLDPAVPEGHQLRGIALTRLGRAAEATESLRTASELAPYVAKHAYNLAVNLQSLGKNDEALAAARQALEVEPRHAAALELVRSLGGDSAPVAEAPEVASPVAPRGGYGAQRHLLPFMYGMEKVWDGLAYGFMGAAICLAVLMIVHLPMGPTGAKVPTGNLPDIALKHDPLSIFVCFLYLLSSMCTFMWMFADIIDRRKKFSWMVPVVACGVLGMNAVPLMLYFFIGRKLGETGVADS